MSSTPYLSSPFISLLDLIFSSNSTLTSLPPYFPLSSLISLFDSIWNIFSLFLFNVPRTFFFESALSIISAFLSSYLSHLTSSSHYFLCLIFAFILFSLLLSATLCIHLPLFFFHVLFYLFSVQPSYISWLCHIFSFRLSSHLTSLSSYSLDSLLISLLVPFFLPLCFLFSLPLFLASLFAPALLCSPLLLIVSTLRHFL